MGVCADWLEGRGMCSNKNGYKYSLKLLGVNASGKCDGSSCPVNANSAQLTLTLSPWWLAGSTQPTQFPVQPTVCNRDYEHMRGPSGIPMRGCTPKSTCVPDDQITNAQASALELHGTDVDTGVHACRKCMHHPRACMHGLIILDEGIFFSSLTECHACWLSS
jgi:hypothetical protein